MQFATKKKRDEFILKNIGLVKKQANYFSNSTYVPYDDLYQIGCIGLINAVDKFEIEKGNKFSSFAVPTIKGEILHYLRDKYTLIKFGRKINLARTSKNSEEREKAINLTKVASLNSIFYENGEELIETITDDKNNENNRELLEEIFNLIKPNMREIIYQHYIEGVPQTELMKEFNMKRPTINTSIHRNFQKVREIMLTKE
jgi:RNA polymerase sigma factor (sigma-70 family)